MRRHAVLAVADAVVLSSGWTRRLIAVAAGAVGALAMAPLDLAPALVITMVAAVWLLDGSSGSGAARSQRPGSLRPGSIWPGLAALRDPFGAGWWLGFGYFLAGLWWLGSAFLMDPEFAWALPLGVVGVPAILALFTGIGFVLARLLWVPGPARIFALALGLGLAEWGRGHLFTGFPWNAFGMGLGGHLMSAQIAALVGLDGLTMVTIALFAAPATLCDGNGRLTWRPTLVAGIGLALILGYGFYRLSQAPPRDVPNVIVRIMQPGLLPNQDFVPKNKDKILARYIDLSQRKDIAKGIKLADVTVLVWPESAFPFILTRDPQSLASIGRFLPPRTVLVTGAAREEEAPRADGRPQYTDYYNAILVIASGGTVVDTYDKVHLVPFGEYLPFSAVLSQLGLRNFVAIPGGFEPGQVRRALDIPGMPPATPLICYEAIFSGEVGLSQTSVVTRFLLNVTNDGWFGMTFGPAQHFAQARLRTIEEGLPMVRGAATGISGIIDAYGRVRESMALGQDGIIDGPLPAPVARPPFARYGRTMTWAVWLSTVSLLMLTHFSRK